MKSGKTVAIVAGGASLLGLVCWLIMFLAGHDVWHDLGRPDFWKFQGPPYADLRAFAYAFYLQFLLLVGTMVGSAYIALRRPRSA